MAKPRVKVPKSAAVGDIITIKTLISHKMETGQRKDKKTGEVIPRNIINKFVCEFNGQQVFSTDIEPAISANPYFEFNMKVAEAGTFKFSWIDDDGKETTIEKEMAIE